MIYMNLPSSGDTEPPYYRDKGGTPYEYGECEDCGGTGQQMIARLYPSGHTECWENCEICHGEGLTDCEIIEPNSPWEAFYEVRRA